MGYSSSNNGTSNKAVVTLYPELPALDFTFCLHNKDGGDRYLKKFGETNDRWRTDDTRVWKVHHYQGSRTMYP